MPIAQIAINAFEATASKLVKSINVESMHNVIRELIMLCAHVHLDILEILILNVLTVCTFISFEYQTKLIICFVQYRKYRTCPYQWNATKMTTVHTIDPAEMTDVSTHVLMVTSVPEVHSVMLTNTNPSVPVHQNLSETQGSNVYLVSLTTCLILH